MAPVDGGTMTSTTTAGVAAEGDDAAPAEGGNADTAPVTSTSPRGTSSLEHHDRPPLPFPPPVRGGDSSSVVSTSSDLRPGSARASGSVAGRSRSATPRGVVTTPRGSGSSAATRQPSATKATSVAWGLGIVEPPTGASLAVVSGPRGQEHPSPTGAGPGTNTPKASSSSAVGGSSGPLPGPGGLRRPAANPSAREAHPVPARLAAMATPRKKTTDRGNRGESYARSVGDVERGPEQGGEGQGETLSGTGGGAASGGTPRGARGPSTPRGAAGVTPRGASGLRRNRPRTLSEQTSFSSEAGGVATTPSESAPSESPAVAAPYVPGQTPKPKKQLTPQQARAKASKRIKEKRKFKNLPPASAGGISPPTGAPPPPRRVPPTAEQLLQSRIDLILHEQALELSARSEHTKTYNFFRNAVRLLCIPTFGFYKNMVQLAHNNRPEYLYNVYRWVSYLRLYINKLGEGRSLVNPQQGAMAERLMGVSKFVR